MKSKFVQFAPILIAVVSLVFAKLSLGCIYLKDGTYGACYTTWINHIYDYFTSPLYFFALYSLPLAIVLIFVRRDVFNFWVNPAIVILVVSLGFIATTPVSSAALISITRDDTARICACVFSAVSALLIMRKYYTLHSGHPKYFS